MPQVRDLLAIPDISMLFGEKPTATCSRRHFTGLEPDQFHGWVHTTHAPDDPMPHDDWDRDGFLANLKALS